MAASSVARPRPRQKSRLGRQEARWFFLLITPWIIGFTVFTAGPIIASSYLSFTHNDPVNWPPVWVGTQNYQEMFGSKLFWQSLKVTAYYTALQVPLSIIAAIFVALLLNQKVPLLSMFRSIYYLPAICPAVAVALMWGWVFNPSFGLLDGTLWTVSTSPARSGWSSRS